MCVTSHLYSLCTTQVLMQMLMVCHHLDRNIPEDLAFAESRIRAETVAAEDVLHDIGAISMISSDSQAMGRVGEVVSRTWRTASKMRECTGPLTSLGDVDGVDNGRVKRYIAKYTINPCVNLSFLPCPPIFTCYLSSWARPFRYQGRSRMGSVISSDTSLPEHWQISCCGNQRTLARNPR